CRARRTGERGPRGELYPDRGPDVCSDGMARALQQILGRAAGCPRPLSRTGERTMAAVKEKPSLTIVRRLKANPERVWRALTQADELRRWFYPSPDFTVLHAETDL